MSVDIPYVTQGHIHVDDMAVLEYISYIFYIGGGGSTL